MTSLPAADPRPPVALSKELVSAMSWEACVEYFDKHSDLDKADFRRKGRSTKDGGYKLTSMQKAIEKHSAKAFVEHQRQVFGLPAPPAPFQK